MTRPRPFRALCPAALLLAALASGCGQAPPPANSVSGTVRLDGKKLSYGTVAFHTGKGRVLKAQILRDGTYSLYDPPEGETRVVVQTGPPPRPAAGGGGGPAPSFEPVTVPAKYRDPKTTDLRCTVVAGKTSFDVDMKSPPEG